LKSIFEMAENVVVAKDASGNFVMAETLDELKKLAEKGEVVFPENPSYDQGRIEKDADGKFFASFRKADGTERYRIYA
jgi:hypothetical protein